MSQGKESLCAKQKSSRISCARCLFFITLATRSLSITYILLGQIHLVKDFSFKSYTQFYRIKGSGSSWRPPPPPHPMIFEWHKLPHEYRKNILILQILAKLRLFLKGRKNIRLLAFEIIVNHVIWRFRIYDCFREIFKFWENMETEIIILQNLLLLDGGRRQQILNRRYFYEK